MSGYVYGWNTLMAIWLYSWNPCLVGMLVCDLRQFIKRYKSYTQTPAMFYLLINTMSNIRLYLQNDTMSKIRLSEEKYFDIHANYTWIQCCILLLVKQTVMHKVLHHTIDKPHHVQRISRLGVLTTNKWNKRRKAEQHCCRIKKKCGKLVKLQTRYEWNFSFNTSFPLDCRVKSDTTGGSVMVFTTN